MGRSRPIRHPRRARQALLPRLSQCIHYRRSRLAEHAHHTITSEGNLSPDFARFHSLSLPWEPAKVELVAQSEGRKSTSPPSSSSSSSIHPSLTLFLNKMRFFLLSQLGRKSLVCKQIEGSFVCSESIPVKTAPSLTAAATQCSERDGNGRRACAGLVCNGEGRRAEGRSKATFPPRQKTFNPSNE